MNWTITIRKTLEGAVMGGLAAAAAISVSQNDPNYWGALAAAALAGAIKGGLNVWKHV